MSKMTTIFSHSRFPFPRYYPVSSHGLPLWEDILKRKIKRETRSVTCPRSLSCEMHSNPELCEQLHHGTLAGGWYSATLLPIMTDIAPHPRNTTLLLYVCREARRFTAESSILSSIPTTATQNWACVCLGYGCRHSTTRACLPRPEGLWEEWHLSYFIIHPGITGD